MFSGLFEKNTSEAHKPSTSTQIKDPLRQKSCSICPATFTRKSHLDRHIRSHMNERAYQCETCEMQFTRGDVLARHRQTCGGSRRCRRKSCEACARAKVKCNLQHPCQKCTTRGITCEFTNDPSIVRPKAVTATSVRGTRRHTGTASSHAGPSTRAPTPEGSGSGLITAPPHSSSTPNPGKDLSSTSNLLLPPSPSASRDTLAAFSHLGVGNSMLSNPDNHLAPSSSLNFNQLTNGFMQLLESNDIAGAGAAFDFDTFASIPPCTTATDAIQTFDNASRNISPSNSSSSSDFFNFDFSYEVSVTPSSVSSGPVSEYVHLPIPVQSTTMTYYNAEPIQASFATDDELHVYTYLFFSAFIPRLPVVHEATWREDDKPPVLLRVMQACGALFIRTKPAVQFVIHVLMTARQEIFHEYACKTNDPHGQIYLILAFALLQTLGFSSQHAQERGGANVYHGMLKMMITQSRVPETIQAWIPPELDTPVEEAWRAWAHFEMAKRLCCLERLHDCTQVIFFCMPSSSELVFDGYLPCDDELWNARSSQDWAASLHTSSRYGSPTARLRGANAQSVLMSLVERTPPTATVNLPAFAHYFLIHVLISCIYSHMHSCTWSPSLGSSDVNGTLQKNHVDQHTQAAYILQNALRSWLASWQDESNKSTYSKSSIFTSASVLPYYRLAQVSLLMLCDSEGGVPWRHGPPTYKDVGTEGRFPAFTEWIRQMRRRFQIAQSDPSPEDLREDLMRLCILHARAQVTNGGITGMATDPIDGLLAFFLVPQDIDILG